MLFVVVNLRDDAREFRGGPIHFHQDEEVLNLEGVGMLIDVNEIFKCKHGTMHFSHLVTDLSELIPNFENVERQTFIMLCKGESQVLA